MPEIEIVEDDDPRIVFHPEGKQTRVQTVHDHVIRNPSINLPPRHSTDNNDFDDFPPPPPFHDGGRRPSSTASLSLHPTTGTGRDASEILDQGPYLPSRWAKGDKQLRTTEDEKDKYRPMEWGGKKGELGGRVPEWK